MEDRDAGKRVRGQGRGGGFFAIGRDTWESLWLAPAGNRLNLILTYLVLLAGTGSDHRLTKWSAKACEQYLGIGKPRAKVAIEELICSDLVKRTDASTRMMPQYELPALSLEADPIFLPIGIITGLSDETPVLRRVREVGDPLLLRMLIDLYGMVALDAAHGVPIRNLRLGLPDGQASARKISEAGAHAVWALQEGGHRHAEGAWTTHHYSKSNTGVAAWSDFWTRLDTLKQIGAIWYEPWLFDGEGLDAEPLLPLDPAALYAVADQTDDESRLTRLAFEAAYLLVGDRQHVFDRNAADFFVPLPGHHQPPALRHVARLRVEPDTPGRRLSWRKRRLLVEQRLRALEQLITDLGAGKYTRPMKLPAVKEPF